MTTVLVLADLYVRAKRKSTDEGPSSISDCSYYDFNSISSVLKERAPANYIPRSLIMQIKPINTGKVTMLHWPPLYILKMEDQISTYPPA